MNLYVLFGIGCLCLVLNPFFQNINLPILYKQPLYSKQRDKTYETIKTNQPKKIVLLTSSFLPDHTAGSEISAYELLKYLRKRGHSITIISKESTVHSFDKFPIYIFNMKDPYIVSTIQNADVVFFQIFGNKPDNFECLAKRTKPNYLFLHVRNQYKWIIQHKLSFPTVVVYNSNHMRENSPTLHSSLVLIPYVDTEIFKPLRNYTRQTSVVGILNCNISKGGQIFSEIASKLPNVQFLAVKGHYGDHDNKILPNITYIPTQKDTTKIYMRIGILVMPSESETWGRTAVEAMAAGIPVIHSEVEGLVECVGGAGIQCNRVDIDAWVSAIQRILGDRAYREQLRQQGFERVEQIEILQRQQRFELAESVETINEIAYQVSE